MCNNNRSIKVGPFEGVLEDTFCRVCGEDTAAELIFKSKEGIGYYECMTCHVMYASPRFTEESMLKIYETREFADFAPYEDWSYEQWRQGKDRTYHVEQEKLKLVKKYLQGGERILDVGCGTGLFVLEAIRNGFVCEGIEPSSMLSEIGLEKLAIPLSNVKIDDFSPAYKFQIIMIWDVLEHVYDPVGVLKSCAKLLASGGVIFVQVPNYKGISNLFKTFLCRIGLRGHFKHFGFPWHIYSFDKAGLSVLMMNAGFKPLLFESWSHLLKDGKTDIFSQLAIAITKKLCFSDYIVCVAQKFR